MTDAPRASRERRIMAAKIRVGIVGATVTPSGSGWGAHAHVPALHALPDYELKAVCTAHEETARASAAAFGAELAFHDFDAMVAHPDVDLVAVVVRVPGHYPLVVKALEAGKAVFCEWPLGATLAEARALAAGEPFEPDFTNAVQRHTLLAAIERSSAEGCAVRA
jgi:predicted dehydrogenase